MPYIKRNLEIKRSVNPGSEPAAAFNILNKGNVPKGNGAIICMRPHSPP